MLQKTANDEEAAQFVEEPLKKFKGTILAFDASAARLAKSKKLIRGLPCRGRVVESDSATCGY